MSCSGPKRSAERRDRRRPPPAGFEVRSGARAAQEHRKARSNECGAVDSPGEPLTRFVQVSTFRHRPTTSSACPISRERAGAATQRHWSAAIEHRWRIHQQRSHALAGADRGGRGAKPACSRKALAVGRVERDGPDLEGSMRRSAAPWRSAVAEDCRRVRLHAMMPYVTGPMYRPVRNHANTRMAHLHDSKEA